MAESTNAIIEIPALAARDVLTDDSPRGTAQDACWRWSPFSSSEDVFKV
jgi:hypothetical protein